MRSKRPSSIWNSTAWAPFAGVVATVRGRVGEWVEPGAPRAAARRRRSLAAGEGFAPANIVASTVGSRVKFALSHDGEGTSLR